MDRFTDFFDTRKMTLVALLHDAVVSVFAITISFILAFGSIKKFLSADINLPMVYTLAVVIQLLSLFSSGLYKSIWRYSSTLDLIKLIKGVTLGVAFSAILIFFFNRLNSVPRSVFFIDWLVMIVGLGGGRLAYRVIREHYGVLEIAKTFDTKAVIVGAGAAGEQLVREIRRSPHLKVKIVAIVDDDLQKRGKVLHGIPILGGISDLTQVVDRFDASQVYIAIASASSLQIDRIVRNCRDTGVGFKTLPHIKDILNGKISVSHLRDLKLDDLLGREQTTLDETSIREMVTNATILVSGAGGSIGSELCRQICKYKPKRIVLLDFSEFNLYSLKNSILEEFPEQLSSVCIGDVREKSRVLKIFKMYKPDVVFHAAAYKHVPMMEDNPRESVMTNVFGTKNMAEASSECNVKRFVLVSTDKAVRPTNVMGATKRVAEMICQDIYRKSSDTRFMIVRFGNVLGSSGSVIPRFKEQIKRGGPITVTHPEVTRFFMSIPEACQLVLQAGSMGAGGDIFLLDMGKPVKILHLAKQMISLCGLTEKEISIKFTGLRPGEKLYEELLLESENILPTCNPLLKIAKSSKNPDHFERWLREMEKKCLGGIEDSMIIKLLLKEIVSDYEYHSAPKGVEDQSSLH